MRKGAEESKPPLRALRDMENLQGSVIRPTLVTLTEKYKCHVHAAHVHLYALHVRREQDECRM